MLHPSTPRENLPSSNGTEKIAEAEEANSRDPMAHSDQLPTPPLSPGDDQTTAAPLRQVPEIIEKETKIQIGASGKTSVETSAETLTCLFATPPECTGTPILFIHGDYHNRKIWLQKPDGGLGWAQYFYQNGHPVHVVDLPHATRPPVQGEGYNIEYPYTVQNEYTCPSQRPQDVRCAYNQVARTHDKWPGTGRVDDPIFRNYYDSRVMLRYTASYRQATSQLLLAEVLDTVGKALIIAEGTGCQMAWLAGDIRPERVAGIISVEPAGPPFGSARDTTKSHNHARWLRSVKHNQNVRRWGLTDVPLSYDPPLPLPEDILNEPRGLSRLNICLRRSPEVDNIQGGLIWLQADGSQFGDDRYDGDQFDGDQSDGGQFVYEAMISDQSPVRKLHNLAKFPHVVVTAPASQHSLFDHATVAFMRQAGLQVTWERLEKRGILGNGTLMFLETNSDDIAHVISENIQRLGLCPGDAANKTK